MGLAVDDAVEDEDRVAAEDEVDRVAAFVHDGQSGLRLRTGEEGHDLIGGERRTRGAGRVVDGLFLVDRRRDDDRLDAARPQQGESGR